MHKMSHLLEDQKNRTMWLRRRCCKRTLSLITVFAVSFYASVLFFGDFKTPRVMRLTSLSRCPACYGVSICPELYSNQITVEDHRWRDLLFNVKNIFYGYTKSNRKVILKKLAYDSELQEFDEKLCKTFMMKKNCKPIDLLNATGVEKRIIDIVHYNSSLHPRKGLTFCPYPHGIYDFIKPMLDNRNGKSYKSDLINVWTMLSINAEPIVLQVIPKSKGWKVPAYAGVCGRLEVVANEGTPLSSLADIAWHRKLAIAKQILAMAMDFTFKHDRYRFYFYDWSADNIVVNEKDEVSYIDLEDVIVLDKHITPKRDLPHWYQRYIKDDNEIGYMFSIDLICKHHLSDHNIYSAGYVLNGDDKPFLQPIPKEFKSDAFVNMLDQCLRGPDRFKAASLLQRYITDLLSRDSGVGFGAVR